MSESGIIFAGVKNLKTQEMFIMIVDNGIARGAEKSAPGVLLFT